MACTVILNLVVRGHSALCCKNLKMLRNYTALSLYFNLSSFYFCYSQFKTHDVWSHHQFFWRILWGVNQFSTVASKKFSKTYHYKMIHKDKTFEIMGAVVALKKRFGTKTLGTIIAPTIYIGSLLYRRKGRKQSMVCF